MITNLTTVPSPFKPHTPGLSIYTRLSVHTLPCIRVTLVIGTPTQER